MTAPSDPRHQGGRRSPRYENSSPAEASARFCMITGERFIRRRDQSCGRRPDTIGRNTAPPDPGRLALPLFETNTRLNSTARSTRHALESPPHRRPLGPAKPRAARRGRRQTHDLRFSRRRVRQAVIRGGTVTVCSEVSTLAGLPPLRGWWGEGYAPRRGLRTQRTRAKQLRRTMTAPKPCCGVIERRPSAGLNFRRRLRRKQSPTVALQQDHCRSGRQATTSKKHSSDAVRERVNLSRYRVLRFTNDDG